MNLAVPVSRLQAATARKMKKSAKKERGLRSFPWSGKEALSKGEALVGSTLGEWYEAKHRMPSDEELSFVNSLPVESCPHCGSDSFKKDGFTKAGLCSYRCKSCGKRFNPLTGTVFDAKKIPISEWIEFLMHLFSFHSLRSSSFSNRNSEKTGKYWLSKVFAVLGGIQDGIVLSGKVWIDETFVPVMCKDAVKKDGKLLRGISRNMMGIAVATDGKRSVFISTGASKPSKASTFKAYSPHIAKGSTIVHDGEKSHSRLIEELGLSSEAHASSKTKGLDDSENPLYPVNRLHYFLQRFLGEHDGFKREDLQDWLNLFWFVMNGPSNPYGKALRFIERAVSVKKVIRYRKVFPRKRD